MTNQEPTLADLDDGEAFVIGRELAAISNDVPYPQAQAWARHKAWLIAEELDRRIGSPSPPRPELVTLSDLAPVHLRRLADRVGVVAALEAADGEAGPAARWWRALHARIVAAIENRERDAAPLRQWLHEHPVSHEVPADTPTWREISGLPDAE
ncbi:hypothetical protein [Mycobacterium parmense]|uniref:Uncharacterized protein n=1 Tax=Mycobacterium parmense TaxID=185642 RepID=A0A7I7YSB5_9MYCO|nr:hypothetical protein [Mycobacterium parmense]MCV7351795.1 hypothetical protein [Mycobacterium parmense]ORW63015.1 hypothetical protein AWC20_04585 [Mycobacterium parmense]BBZ44735.1 hypothetical protein MPRM_20160 [Mycobacterium parmense]